MEQGGDSERPGPEGGTTTEVMLAHKTVSGEGGGGSHCYGPLRCQGEGGDLNSSTGTRPSAGTALIVCFKWLVVATVPSSVSG